MVVSIPLLFMPGLEGRLFLPLALAYIVAIAASLVVSVTLTPALCYWLRPQRAALLAEKGDGWLLGHIEALARSGAVTALRHSGAVAVVAVVMAAAGVAGRLSLSRTFLPGFNEGAILVGVRLAQGSSLQAASQVGALAERLILKEPDVASVGRKTGRAEGDLPLGRPATAPAESGWRSGRWPWATRSATRQGRRR